MTDTESTASTESGVSNGSVRDELHEPVITLADVTESLNRIRDAVPQTPCELSKMSESLGMQVYFKKDYQLHTGSFKERGARNTLVMLSDEQKKKGVIAASAGNHALALSYHGQQLGIPVTVVMPTNAPINKIASCRKYGADVHVKGSDLMDSKDVAFKMCEENGLLYINGYDHPDILAGAGTMGLEIMEQVKNVDAVIIPVGGGGLIAGVSVAVKASNPRTLVIGVESEGCASFTAAMNAGKPVKIDVNHSMTLADGLCVSKVGENAFYTAHKLIDRMITVREEYIALAVLRLVEEEKATIEGAGSIGLAAVLAGQVPELKGKRVVIALCGGNIDSVVLGRCLERGLVVDGRLVRFVVTVSDRPGGIAELTKLLAENEASVKDIFHERAWLISSIFSAQVKVIAEVRDRDHGNKLKEVLQSKYGQAFLWGAEYNCPPS